MSCGTIKSNSAWRAMTATPPERANSTTWCWPRLSPAGSGAGIARISTPSTLNAKGVSRMPQFDRETSQLGQAVQQLARARAALLRPDGQPKYAAQEHSERD